MSTVTTRNRRLTSVLAACAASVLAQCAQADTWDNNFHGSGTGHWSTGGNWEDNTEPAINDAVIFPAGIPNGDSSIELDPGEVAVSLTINDNYTFGSVVGGPAGDLRLRDGDITVASGTSAVIDVNLTCSAAMSKIGQGALTLSKPVTLAGQSLVLVEQGTMTLTSGASLSSDLTIMESGLCTANVTGAGSVWSVGALSMAVDSGGSSTLNITAGGTVTAGNNINGGNTLATSTITLDGGTLDMQGHRIGNSSSGGAAFIDVRNFRSGTLKSLAEINNGTVPLVKTTSGTLILDGDNSYTGGTTITQGTLQIGNGGTSGLILGDVTNNGVLAFNRSNSISFGGVISGTGSLSKLGGGILSLTGSNTYAGTTTISTGTVQVGRFGTTGTIGNGSGAVINNGSLTFTRSNAMTIPNNISGTGSVLQAGTGTTTFSGVLTYAGNTGLIDGKFIFATNLTSSASLTIAFAGAIELASNGTSQRVIKTGAVNITEQGRLDLKDNKLIVAGGSVPAITALIQSGLNGGAWDGPGIITSMPDALNSLTTIGVASGEQMRGLGPADTDLFSGQTINGASVIAMYTYAGDANLDGTINPDDFANIAFFDNDPSATGYFNGDFNYDGDINADDHALITFNFNAQGAQIPTAAPLTPIPEPALVFPMLAVTAVLACRRRNIARQE